MKKQISLLSLSVLASIILFACQKPEQGGTAPTPTPTPPAKGEKEVVAAQISVVLPEVDTKKIPIGLIKEAWHPLSFDAVLKDNLLTIQGNGSYSVKLVADKPVTEDINFTLCEQASVFSQLDKSYKVLSHSNVTYPTSVVIPKGKKEVSVTIGVKTNPAFASTGTKEKGFVTVLNLKSESKKALFSGNNQSLIGLYVGLTLTV